MSKAFTVCLNSVKGAATRLHRPLYFTVHGMYYDPFELRSVPTHSHRIISVSLPVQTYIPGMGFSSTVIPNGVDMNEFCPRGGGQTRHDLGIPDKALVLVNAGRLAGEKADVAKTTMQVTLGMEF